MKVSTLRLGPEATQLAQSLLGAENQKTLRPEDIPETRAGDELWSYLLFKKVHQRAPTTALRFTDFLYRLKVSDELTDPLRVFVSDKEFVKTYIKETVGDQYNIPTLKVLKDHGEIDSFDFPSSCCIKPTHASGMKVIRSGEEPLDKQAIKNFLGVNYYKVDREINYKFLKPKVIVEPYIQDGYYIEGSVHCREGKAKIVSLIDRQTKRRESFSTSGEPLGFSLGFPLQKLRINSLRFFKELLENAERLAAPFSFIRVDFYTNEEKILFGELTNLPSGGHGKFHPPSGEDIFSKIFFD